jgi:hypothetical protein
MSIIFPGNYVAHLNAYREQGVEALPGVEFYSAVGALPLNPDVFTELVNGELPALTAAPVYVLSPDLRQDDKPRKDKPLVIPADSVIYKTAISAPGVREATVAGTTTVVIAAPTGSDADTRAGDKAVPATPTLTAEADGYFPEEGVVSDLKSIVDGIAIGSETAVTITTNAALIASLDPSAGACRNSPSAILVEVCYFVPAPAPSYDDAHVPYAVEAGQGT